MPKKRQKISTVFLVDDNQENLGLFRGGSEPLSLMPYFSQDVENAKSIMAGVAADLVICSLNVAGQSTADFLLHVKKKCPNAIRIVYSDEQNTLSLMRLVASGIAHRQLVFPMDTSGIEAILAQDLLTRSRLKAKKCWDFLDAGVQIPVLSKVVQRLEEVLSDPEYSMAHVVEVVEQDPGLASRLLQVVNSSIFPKRAVISDLTRAVTYLGVNHLKEILLFISAREMFEPSKQCGNHAMNVAHHSFRCSRLAAMVASEIAPGEEKQAATAALLHDIGKLVFLTSPYCAHYLGGVACRDQPHSSTAALEEDVFGITHEELGSSILLWWNLPMTLVETAANHTLPLADLWSIPKCVAIADRCLKEARYGDMVQTDLSLLPAEYPLAKWRKTAAKMLEGVTAG